jgi:hypothetical protein
MHPDHLSCVTVGFRARQICNRGNLARSIILHAKGIGLPRGNRCLPDLAASGQARLILGQSDKILDGKPVNMGTLEFHYVEDQRLSFASMGRPNGG